MEQCVFNVCFTAGPLPVGRLHINGIGQLVRLNPPSDTVSYIAPSLNDLDIDSDDESGECLRFLYWNNDQKLVLLSGDVVKCLWLDSL